MPIPTFPPVVKMLPMVFALPIATKLLVIVAVPAVMFVSDIFVVVTFTTVSVPATFKLPDKLRLAPVIVVADSQLEPNVAKVPLVAFNEPVETPPAPDNTNTGEVKVPFPFPAPMEILKVESDRSIPNVTPVLLYTSNATTAF